MTSKEAIWSQFQTYSSYYEIDEEEQKKVLGLFNGSFLRNPIVGGH